MSDDYMDYLDNFADDNTNKRTVSVKNRNRNRNTNGNRNNRRRKGLKWKLIALYENKIARIALVLAVILIIIIAIVSAFKNNDSDEVVVEQSTTVAPTTQITSYQINGVPVIPQDNLKAACETYACTMLLQHLGFDIDEVEFVDNYLITKPVYYGVDGTLYGPDMNSAYAGDIYTGYGINAPGMAKCMNNYLKTTNSKLTAYPLLNVSLDDLCEEYILNDVPVMVWATTYMDEPYVFADWVVDYADEDSTVKIGDVVSWQMHEHCMVLIGFDEENYYFCDSVSGKVSVYDKATSEERYSQIGMQAIVVK